MFVPTCFDTTLLFLYSIYLVGGGGDRPAFSLLAYHHVKFFMPLYIMQIYVIVHTFLLQEELYSYCNRVKRSILEVRYIVLYRSYPDRQRHFISTWEQNEWITGKKDEIDCSKEQS